MKYFKADKQHPAAVSLPVRGAWVEISVSIPETNGATGRSPCGERGLKLITPVSVPCTDAVAPRAGSVG